MELILATHGLEGFGGSETYLLTVAEQLQRLGHGVTVHAHDLGPMSRLFRERGLRVASESDLPSSCDATIVQDSVTALSLAERYPGAPQLFVAHAAGIDLQLPPQLAGLTRVVVAMSDQVERRMRAMAVEPEVVRLRQPVDLRRFSPRGPTPERPDRVLLLGNHLAGSRADLVLHACGELGWEVDRVGRHGRPTGTPEAAILDADVVIGYGRSILEAMACGRAAFVLDHTGAHGWVSPDSYPSLEADGFSGTAALALLGPAELTRELQGYRPEMGLANRDLAFSRHGAHGHAQRLAQILRGLAPSAVAADAPLGEMARLARMQWSGEGRALQLEIENRDLRRRLHEAHLRAHEIRNTRRYRLAAMLAAPIEAARRRRGPS